MQDPIRDLFDSIDAAYDYFDFVPDWVVYPFYDARGYLWKVDYRSDGIPSHVTFWKPGDEGDPCGGPVYTQRFYDQWVYRGKDHTMVFYDSGTDQMRYLAIFDNNKEMGSDAFDADAPSVKGDVIDDLFSAIDAAYAYFDFVPNWVVCPFDDKRGYTWHIEQFTENYAEVDFRKDSDPGGALYGDEVYTQRFYDKWVYRGKDYTMVFCEPHVDMMQWFRIFENARESKEALLPS